MSDLPRSSDRLRRNVGWLGWGLALLVVAVLAAAGLTLGAWPWGRGDAIEALLQVQAREPYLLFKPEAETDLRSYLKTLHVMMKTQTVLSAALAQSRIRDLVVVQRQADPVAWLAEHLDIEDTDEIVRVRLHGANPKEQVSLINAVVDACMIKIINVENSRRMDRFNRLQSLYHSYQNRIEQQRQELAKLQEVAGVGVGDQAEADLARRELMRVRLEKVEVETRLGRVETAEGDEPASELRERLDVLRAQEAMLVESLGKAAGARPSGQDVRALEARQEEIRLVEEVARQLGQTIERLTIELEAPSRVELIERATTP